MRLRFVFVLFLHRHLASGDARTAVHIPMMLASMVRARKGVLLSGEMSNNCDFCFGNV